MRLAAGLHSVRLQRRCACCTQVGNAPASTPFNQRHHPVLELLVLRC